MRSAIAAEIYDHPEYYDLIFGTSVGVEVTFLQSCFDKHAKREIRRLYEPACGTGRLLLRFVQSGFEVCGSDLNPRAVQYCNSRLERKGLPAAAVLGDMADFKLRRKVDSAYSTLNSFRHILSEQSAEMHLRSVAASLLKGGLYVLGIHLIPTQGKRMAIERSEARRGRLSVVCRVWSKRLDLRKREEVCGMAFDIRMPRRQLRVEGDLVFRTYTARQMRSLLRKIDEFELVAMYDFEYESSETISVAPETEDVIYVLRRR